MKPSWPAVAASESSFLATQAASSQRKSIDSVFAIAARPRGCSLPVTQTSNGRARPACSTWPTTTAKSPAGCSTSVVHDGLPPGRLGRLGQRSEASAGAGIAFRAMRRSASDCGRSCGASREASVAGGGSTDSTAPVTSFGR